MQVSDVHRSLGQPEPFSLSYTLKAPDMLGPCSLSVRGSVAAQADTQSPGVAATSGAPYQDAARSAAEQQEGDALHAAYTHTQVQDSAATLLQSDKAAQRRADAALHRKRKAKLPAAAASQQAVPRAAAAQQQTAPGSKQRRLLAQRIGAAPGINALSTAQGFLHLAASLQAQPSAAAAEVSGTFSSLLCGTSGPQQDTGDPVTLEDDARQQQCLSSRPGQGDSTSRALHAAGDGHGFASLLVGDATCDGFASHKDEPAMIPPKRSMPHFSLAPQAGPKAHEQTAATHAQGHLISDISSGDASEPCKAGMEDSVAPCQRSSEEKAQHHAGTTDVLAEQMAAAAMADTGAAPEMSLDLFMPGATCSGFGTCLGLFRQGAACAGSQTSFSGLFGSKQDPEQAMTNGSSARNQPEIAAAPSKAEESGSEGAHKLSSCVRLDTCIENLAGERSNPQSSRQAEGAGSQKEPLSFADIFSKVCKRKQPSRLGKKSKGGRSHCVA